MKNRQLILASGSAYKKGLLSKLLIPFRTITPDIDETPHNEESALNLALRLSVEKTEQISKHHKEAIVIGADQVVEVNGRIYGKPNNHENAIQQLQEMQGNIVQIHTGVCVSCLELQEIFASVNTSTAKMRALTKLQINKYLSTEQPYDCAGSVKSEGLGVSLFDYIKNDDPSSIIGLPLITTSNYLRSLGVEI